MKAVFKSSESYGKKIDLIKTLLRESLEDLVVFEPYENIDFKSVTDCKGDQPYCDNGKLHIPELNLFNGKRNEHIYYDRLSDEFIRYKQIREFIIKKDTHLPFQETRYIVSSSEIILLKSMVDGYLDELVAAKPNKNTTYDNAVPEKEQNEKVFIDTNLEFT